MQMFSLVKACWLEPHGLLSSVSLHPLRPVLHTCLCCQWVDKEWNTQAKNMQNHEKRFQFFFPFEVHLHWIRVGINAFPYLLSCLCLPEHAPRPPRPPLLSAGSSRVAVPQNQNYHINQNINTWAANCRCPSAKPYLQGTSMSFRLVLIIGEDVF